MNVMKGNIAEMASQVLGMTVEEVTLHHKRVPEIDGYYIWNPTRGGRSMLVSRDGDRLVATSAIGYSRHLSDYLAGRRN